MKWLEKHDALNFKKALFDTEDYFGFPLMLKQDVPMVEKLIPFGARRRNWNGACHFFMEDYRFEGVWSDPVKYIPYFKRFQCIFTPDFSYYTEFPLVMQMWQTYRHLWLGRFYQEKGIVVVPTVGWSDPRSYEFCFRGVPEGSVVTISTLGCIKNPKANAVFEDGLEEMINVINPERIIVYGSPKYSEIEGVEVDFVPSTPDTLFTGERKNGQENGQNSE